MSQERPPLYRITGIGRPLDPSWPTNRAVLLLVPVAGLLGVLWSMFGPPSLGGGTAGSPLSAGFAAAMAAFGGWALGRELDPDRQGSAFIAMAACFAMALLVPEASLLLLFTALVLVRVVNRTVGLPATPLDLLVGLGLVAWCGVRFANPLYPVVAAGAFLADGILPGERSRSRIAAALAICLTVWAGWQDPGAGAGAMEGGQVLGVALEAPSVSSLVSVAILVFLVALRIRATRAVTSVCDARGEPLRPQRVRAGMAVALALALAGLIHGDPGIRSSAFLWAVFLGPVLGRDRETGASGGRE